MPLPKPQRDPASHPALLGIRAVRHSILVNVGLVILKGSAGVLGHSYAMIADAIESASDVLSSVLVWIGLHTASRPPDHNHPYGHGKAEPMAAVIISLLLLAAAILIGTASITNIMTPHEVPRPWTLLVLLLVIAGKELVYRYIRRRGQEIDSNALKGEAQHQRADVITSVTAFIGITIALIGGPGYESADDWAALLAGAWIAWNAWKIFRPAFSELMDEAQPEYVVASVREIALNVPGVQGIDQCFVRKMGFELFVDIHIIVSGELDVRTGHAIAHEVKNKIMEERNQVYDVLVHVEPD